MEIDIREIHQDEEYSTYTLALYTSWGDSARGFEFQRNLRESGDSRAPRPPFDSYCVVNERHNVSFGGVESVVLNGHILKITFSDRAMSELNLPERTVALLLNVEDAEMDNIRSGLAYVFSYGPSDLLPEVVGL